MQCKYFPFPPPSLLHIYKEETNYQTEKKEEEKEKRNSQENITFLFPVYLTDGCLEIHRDTQCKIVGSNVAYKSFPSMSIECNA